MAHLSFSASELRSASWLGWLQSACIAVSLGALCVAVLGAVVLCSAPHDQRNLASVPLQAAPVDLNSGDVAHNACIRQLALEMEQNNYLLNGLIPIAEDRGALLRGRQSAVAMTHDHPGTLEWRLQASLHVRFKAHSFVGLRTQGEKFSPETAQALQHEWQLRSAALPREVVAAGNELLAQATDLYALDAAVSGQVENSNVAGIVQRGWHENGADTKGASRRYSLTIKRQIPGYDVVLELRDEIAASNRPVGNWLSLDFIRIPPSAL